MKRGPVLMNLARVKLSLPLLQELLTEGYTTGGFKCLRGLPEGAEYVCSIFEEDQMAASIIFSHPSFPKVPVFDTIPEVDVVCASAILSPS